MRRDSASHRPFGELRDAVGRALVDPLRTRLGRWPQDEPAEERHSRLRAHCACDVVIDVGANVGQYATKLRAAGYSGRIVSFEPLSSAFTELATSAAADPAWEAHRLALGRVDGEGLLHVAGNSFSSSLLEMEQVHLEYARDSRYMHDETVSVARLDGVWGDLIGQSRAAWLKIDTQGSELEVLNGATARLADIRVVEAELSLVPLYRSQPLWSDVADWLRARGFALVGMEPGIWERHSGRMLQVDAVFAAGG